MLPRITRDFIFSTQLTNAEFDRYMIFARAKYTAWANADRGDVPLNEHLRRGDHRFEKLTVNELICIPYALYQEWYISEMISGSAATEDQPTITP